MLKEWLDLVKKTGASNDCAYFFIVCCMSLFAVPTCAICDIWGKYVK